MKKLIYMLIVTTMSVSLVGCGKDKDIADIDNTVDATAVSSDAQDVPDTSGEAAPEDPDVPATQFATDAINTKDGSSIPWEWTDDASVAAEQAKQRNEAALNGIYGEYLKNNFESGTYYSVVTVTDGGMVLCIANADQILDFYQPQAGQCDVYYGTTADDITCIGGVQTDFEHGEVVGIDKNGYFVSAGTGGVDSTASDETGIYPWAIMEIEVSTLEKSVMVHNYAAHVGNNEFIYAYGGNVIINDASRYKDLQTAVDKASLAGVYFTQLP